MSVWWYNLEPNCCKTGERSTPLFAFGYRVAIHVEPGHSECVVVLGTLGQRTMAFFVPFLALLGVCYAIDGSVLDATGCPVVFEGKCTCGMETYKYWRPSEQVSIRQTDYRQQQGINGEHILHPVLALHCQLHEHGIPKHVDASTFARTNAGHFIAYFYSDKHLMDKEIPLAHLLSWALSKEWSPFQRGHQSIRTFGPKGWIVNDTTAKGPLRRSWCLMKTFVLGVDFCGKQYYIPRLEPVWKRVHQRRLRSHRLFE